MPVNSTNVPVIGRGGSGAVMVVGTDNQPPILEEYPHKKVWLLSDIYVGGPGYRKYIPKVGEVVMDELTGQMSLVTNVDEVTYIPTLTPIKSNSSDEMSEQEGRFFVGANRNTPCARQIFFDDSLSRYTLSIPAQFHLQGEQTSYIVAYKGTVTGESGIPISVRYDQNFNVLGHDIPVREIQQRDSGINTQKYVPPFYCSEKLKEGELVTINAYNDKGGFIYRTNWVVERSALLRDVSDNVKMIANISLESEYIDTTDDSHFNIPEQTLKSSINMMGRVTYTDGTFITYPVDGKKFRLVYMDAVGDAVVGSKGVLGLRYTLSDTETAVNAIHNDGSYTLGRTYTYTIIPRDGAHSVKLYPVPIWVNELVGWQMDWYLFTLDRTQFINVTPNVYLNKLSPRGVFDGKAYGVNQQIDVAIDLGTVNNTFKRHIHPQTVDIRLNRAGTDDIGDKWLIGFDPYQNPPFGQGLFATCQFVNSNTYTVNLANNAISTDHWLELMYKPSKPQFDRNLEDSAPPPNTIRLLVNGHVTDVSVNNWNRNIEIPVVIKPTDTVVIVFLSKLQNNEVFYSLVPLSVRIN